MKHDRVDRFLEVGVWLLFFALLVPAGFVGSVIGRPTAHSPARNVAPAAALASHAPRAPAPSDEYLRRFRT